MNRPKLPERRHVGLRLTDDELLMWREIAAKLGISSNKAMKAALDIMADEDNRKILAAQILQDREKE